MITEIYRYGHDETSVNLSLFLIRLHDKLSQKYLKTEENLPKRNLKLLLIAQGFNSSEISYRLFILRHTVDTHRKDFYRKGNFTGIRDVILFAVVFDTR